MAWNKTLDYILSRFNNVYKHIKFILKPIREAFIMKRAKNCFKNITTNYTLINIIKILFSYLKKYRKKILKQTMLYFNIGKTTLLAATIIIMLTVIYIYIYMDKYI